MKCQLLYALMFQSQVRETNDILRSKTSMDCPPTIFCSSRLKDNHILLSTDGPGGNVLKFKPPMCFNMDDARLVANKIDTILTGEILARYRVI